MNLFQQLWHLLFPTDLDPIPAGIYQHKSAADTALPYRLQLRVEKDGNGILIINASTILHLNTTAVEMVYWLIQKGNPAAAADQITKRFRISHKTAKQDMDEVLSKIETLIQTEDLDPVTFLDMERVDPYSGNLTAPYRLDCAITWQTSDANPHAAPPERLSRELQTPEWFTILDKASQAGIPQIVFTGGEPTLRSDLPELIARAESNGQVTGLMTDGLRLNDNARLKELLQAGLDYLVLILNPDDPQSIRAAHNILAEDIYMIVHLTITETNPPALNSCITQLAEMGVKNISISAANSDCLDLMKELQHQIAQLELKLIWDIAVPYSSQNPVSLELHPENRQPAGDGNAWLYVEPDGDVTPAQNNPAVLGNLLTDPWDTLWEKLSMA